MQVSELHIPDYTETKKAFILTKDDTISKNDEETRKSDCLPLSNFEDRIYSKKDFDSQIPFQSGFLLHRTKAPVFASNECQSIINEAERVASDMGWTSSRHGNYPTTDIPLVELPVSLKFLCLALKERIYPLLRIQFEDYLPDLKKLRVADGFVVKYDAEGGQTELKAHRDGSVVSFNIALNPSDEYEGGGTWFESLGDSTRVEVGEMLSHASGILHGGHGITKGIRYIMVCFVILEGYDNWSMRFYNQVRNL